MIAVSLLESDDKNSKEKKKSLLKKTASNKLSLQQINATLGGLAKRFGS